MITNPPLLQTYHLQIKVDSTLIQKGSIQEKKWKKKTEDFYDLYILFWNSHSIYNLLYAC